MNTLAPVSSTAFSDAELLNEYQQSQSESAFENLVERYQGLVVGAAFRRTHDMELARDVAQEVFATLARKARQLVGRASLSGWLHRAAVYEAAHVLQAEVRRHARQEQFSWESRVLTGPPAGGDLPEETEVLDEALDVLSEPDREAILLHYFQDLSYPEMAGILGLNEATVRQRVSRAVERLGKGLRARGVAKSALMVLTGALAVQATCAAPLGLAQAALAAASVGGATAVVAGGSLGPIAKWAVAASLLLVAGGTLMWELPVGPKAEMPVAGALPPAIGEAPEDAGVAAHPAAAGASDAPVSSAIVAGQDKESLATSSGPGSSGRLVLTAPRSPQAPVTAIKAEARLVLAAAIPTRQAANPPKSSAPFVSAAALQPRPERLRPQFHGLFDNGPGPLPVLAQTEGVAAALQKLREAEVVPPEAANLYSGLLEKVLGLNPLERLSVEDLLSSNLQALKDGNLAGVTAELGRQLTVSTAVKTVESALPERVVDTDAVKEVFTLVEKPLAETTTLLTQPATGAGVEEVVETLTAPVGTVLSTATSAVSSVTSTAGGLLKGLR